VVVVIVLTQAGEVRARDTHLEEIDAANDLFEAAGTLDSQLIDVEQRLIELRLTGTGQDGVRWPARVVGRLGHLAGGVGTGDYPPTDQQGEVHVILKERIRDARAALKTVLQDELTRFNELLRQHNLAPLISQ
jgi:hypothetical protein